MKHRGAVLRVALYSHVYVRHDAISSSCGRKLGLLSGLRRQGVPVEVTAFCCDSDYVADEVRRVRGVADVLRDEKFWDADLHCYEFGIHSELHDSMAVARPGAAKLVFYHSVTPPEMCASRLRPLMEQSMRQRFNLFDAHHVACISEFNRRELRGIGIPADRLSVVPLPAPAVETAEAPTVRRFLSREKVRLLFVGRLVEAKGVRELFEAARRLAAVTADFDLCFAFNSRFSDLELLAELRSGAGASGFGRRIRFVADAPDEVLRELYADTDCVVMPSYHEGFCVPVLEALGAGCFVIASDAGNLPHVIGELGRLVPAGDVTALEDALGEFIGEMAAARAARRLPVFATRAGAMAAEEWWAARTEHLAGYSLDEFERGVGEAFRRALRTAGRPPPEWLEAGWFPSLAARARGAVGAQRSGEA